jgi:hypothetical protein
MEHACAVGGKEEEYYFQRTRILSEKYKKKKYPERKNRDGLTHGKEKTINQQLYVLIVNMPDRKPYSSFTSRNPKYCQNIPD